MKRIFIILFILGCSLTTASAQTTKDKQQDTILNHGNSYVVDLKSKDASLQDVQKEVKARVDKVSNQAKKVKDTLSVTQKQVTDVVAKQGNLFRDFRHASQLFTSVDPRLTELEREMIEYKATRRSLDSIYLDQPFATMSIGVLNEMSAFYSTDSKLENLIKVRIELCEKLKEGRELLQKDYDAPAVQKFMDIILENYDQSANSLKQTYIDKYQLKSDQTQEIKDLYNSLIYYYNGVYYIYAELITNVKSYRSRYANNSQMFSQELSKYLASAKWKKIVDENIVNVPYLNNLYNNYISALYTDPSSQAAKDLEGKFKVWYDQL